MAAALKTSTWEFAHMKKITACISSLIVTMGLSATATAATVADVADIRVVGLFKDAAVLNINDQRKLLRVGGTHRDVRLVAANSSNAMVEYHGKRYTLAMSSEPIRTGFKSSGAQAHLMSNGGTYSVSGSINGRMTSFLVDTGASYVTMSAYRAQSLGLDFGNARKVMVNTANGKTTAHVFKAKSVMIGGIELKNIDAAVIHNMPDDKVLLGMSYLSKVEMEQKNGLMILRYRGEQADPKKAPEKVTDNSVTSETTSRPL
jgi:aspartyl protease family protein